MGEMIHAIIYPYDVQSAPLVRHKDLLDGIDIVSVVSPYSFGLCGRDAGEADKGGNTGIVVEEEFSKALTFCDTVIFTETEMEFEFEKLVYPKIQEAVRNDKNIILLRNVDKKTYDDLDELCNTYNVKFRYCHTKVWIKEELEPKDLRAHVIHNIDTPVVFVLGDGERTCKFETQLVLRKFFKDQGYKVSQIGSRAYCELLGFHSIPTFMFEPRYEMEKIYLFNQFIKKIELTEKPDVILIGIPGAIMSLNGSNATNCGITAYEISNAVSSDVALFCMYYSNWSTEYYKELQQVVKHKLGFDVQNFVLSNTKLDWMGINEGKNKLKFFTINNSKVESQSKELNANEIPAYNIYDKEDAEELCGNVLDKLASYAEIEYF